MGLAGQAQAAWPGDARLGCGHRHAQQAARLPAQQGSPPRLIYLGQKRVARATTYSKNCKRLLAIVEGMAIVSMELIKRDANL